MKRVLYAIATGSIAALMLGAGATGQAGVSVNPLYATAQADAGITQTRVLGEVTAIDANGKQMTVKTEAGSIVTVILDDKTEYLRVPPGETSLDKAIKIASSEVGVGDKIYVRGRVSEDKKSVPAQRLIVMSKADIQKKHDQERAEWRRRGVSGIVIKLDAENKEVTIQTRGREGVKPLIVAAPDSVKFRRYAPDSVKFSDAKPSSFTELQVGDQLRALGDKSADGARFTAEQIVTGSFRTIGGTVTAVAADTGEIKITMLGSKQAFTIQVNKDSMLRRIPPQVAMMIAMRSQGGEGGSSPGAGAGQAPPGGGPPGGGGGARPGGQPGMGPGGERMRPEGGGDFQDMLERMPPVTLAEIKPGDVIAVSSTAGADPSRLTAITLVTGVDAILTAIARGPAGARRPTNLSTGLPSGVLDFGIGQP
jgi:co-chaperonin GroES (HSP10)